MFAIILNSFNNTYIPNYFVLLVPNNFVLPPIHFYLQIIKTQSVLALNTTTALSLHKQTLIKNEVHHIVGYVNEYIKRNINVTTTDILVCLIRLACILFSNYHVLKLKERGKCTSRF